jgi:hypothetical protein
LRCIRDRSNGLITFRPVEGAAGREVSLDESLQRSPSQSRIWWAGPDKIANQPPLEPTQLTSGEVAVRRAVRALYLPKSIDPSIFMMTA